MDLQQAYVIGEILQYITRTPSLKAYVKGDGFIIDNLRVILYYLKEFSLSPITQREIEGMIKKFEDAYEKEKPLTGEDAEMITEKVKLWADRINNELAERIVVEVFTDGTLNFKKLLSGGKSFFPEDIWNTLSDISKSDLNDACNCLLTRSWTPAVMISLRALEDSIRKFYNFKTGNDPQKKGWKNILDELSKIQDINKTLLGYLDYIREIRNTAEHPDEVFDQMEAERVFHQVVNMIIVINQEISPRKPLNELSVKELRVLLKNKKLKTSGKKADLTERLREYSQSL